MKQKVHRQPAAWAATFEYANNAHYRIDNLSHHSTGTEKEER